MIKTIYGKINKYCPFPVMLIFCAFIISGIIHLISVSSVAFSDFFNRYISSFVRAFLAKLTNVIPFSLAETIIIFLPVLLVLMFVGSMASSKKSKECGVRYVCSLLATATLLYSIFVLGFAASYQGSTLEDKLSIERRNISVEELYTTSEFLLEEIDALVSDIKYKYGSLSVKPFTFSEMNTLLNDSYEVIANKYPFIPQLRSNVKYILLSEPMTYTHISGVYTYYTGEANININFPDYTLPYTAAHEMSHQRGIAREDEANFMAFLVCIESENIYIRYSGYLNMFEYVSGALYGADKNAYNKLLDKMDLRVRSEMIAYSRFFDKYRESVASEVSAAVNDTFLKAQGQTEGTKSYGRVVDLAVAYYIK